MSRTINVGRVTSYADAVAGGYTGTREEWEIVLANLGTTAAEVEANRQAVAQDKAAVEGNVTTVGEYKDAAAQSASEAAQSAANAHTDALAATAAKEAAQTAQGIAVEAKEAAAASRTAAESAQSEADTSASAAAGSALAAQNAAATATTQAQAAAQSEANADADAQATAADRASVAQTLADIATAKAAAISDIDAEGAGQVSAVEAKGEETLASIPSDYSTLGWHQMLLAEEVPDTVQEYSFDNAGDISAVAHKRNGATIREDTFVFSEITAVETRTLSGGQSLTITTNLETYETSVVYAAA